jgi:hypothetical protein
LRGRDAGAWIEGKYRKCRRVPPGEGVLQRRAKARENEAQLEGKFQNPSSKHQRSSKFLNMAGTMDPAMNQLRASDCDRTCCGLRQSALRKRNGGDGAVFAGLLSWPRLAAPPRLGWTGRWTGRRGKLSAHGRARAFPPGYARGAVRLPFWMKIKSSSGHFLIVMKKSIVSRYPNLNRLKRASRTRLEKARPHPGTDSLAPARSVAKGDLRSAMRNKFLSPVGSFTPVQSA